MSNHFWRHHWRWLFLPLTVIALAWSVWLLRQSLPTIISSLPQLKAGWLLFTLFGCTLSAYIGFEGFRLLFNSTCPGLYKRTTLAHLYFTGQLMKHLPGRIWSVAYQSAAGQRASVSQWIGLTIMHMGLTVLFSAWVSVSIISWRHDCRLGIGAAMLGAFCYSIVWSSRSTTFLISATQKIPVTLVRRAGSVLQMFAEASFTLKLKMLIFFTASWVIYFGAWAGYGAAWPSLGAADGIWLCALYTLAWLTGYLSFFSPSGLGVRELVFINLAQNFPADAVAGMAIFGRTTLLLVDIILGAAFIPCREPAHE